jgi:hypothetical protein
MKHVLLVVGVVLYVLTWAQNWTWYAGALMLRAIASDWQREEQGRELAWKAPQEPPGSD